MSIEEAKISGFRFWMEGLSMIKKPDKFDFVLVISVIVGLCNGIVVNTNKPLLMETMVILPILGGVLHCIITGSIIHIFDDVIESIGNFLFLCFVLILGISIIPMLLTGIILHFLL